MNSFILAMPHDLQRCITLAIPGHLKAFRAEFQRAMQKSGYALLGVSSEHVRPSAWPVSGSHAAQLDFNLVEY